MLRWIIKSLIDSSRSDRCYFFVTIRIDHEDVYTGAVNKIISGILDGPNEIQSIIVTLTPQPDC
jgi:hypothetical protein